MFPNKKQIESNTRLKPSFMNQKTMDYIMRLSDLNQNKLQNLQIHPCHDDQVVIGQKLYLQTIRPICVTKLYVPEKVTTEQDVQSISFQQQRQRIAKIREQALQQQNLINPVNAKNKKGNKKGGKNTIKQQQMRYKIMRDNLQKDLNLVIKSQSKQRLQYEFGLKNKKIQIKLITFFNVAYYIRRSKNYDNDVESQAYELISILIKIIKIFSGLKWKSLQNTQNEIQISPTLIRDLKLCLKGLKQQYKFNNQTLIIKHPKLIYYTNYDKFFPTLGIKPDQSIIQLFRTIKSCFNYKGQIQRPTLILYKTMIGGKKICTSIGISQLVNQLKLKNQQNNKMQIIYSCPIKSIRYQMQQCAESKSQKIAFAKMERSIKEQDYYYPRIIKNYSCRYQKNINLIITRPYCLYQMLNYHKFTQQEQQIIQFQKKIRKNQVLVGKLHPQNIILYLDQVTSFFYNTYDGVSKTVEILANYPPKLIIMQSSALPDQSELTKTIELIRRKNNNLQVHSIQSRQFEIGCQLSNFKGQIIFPHTGVKSRKQLIQVRKKIQQNSFLIRLYTGPSLFVLINKCKKAGIQGVRDINSYSQIHQKDIIQIVNIIFQLLLIQEDNVIQQVCKLSNQTDNVYFKIQSPIKNQSQSDQEYQCQQNQNYQNQNHQNHQNQNNQDQNELINQKQTHNIQNQTNNIQNSSDENQNNKIQKQNLNTQKNKYVNLKKLKKQDAYKFIGGCLIGARNPVQFAKKYFEKWIANIDSLQKLMKNYLKQVKNQQKQLKKIEQNSQLKQQQKSWQVYKLLYKDNPQIAFPQHKVINSQKHYNKYCKQKQNISSSKFIKRIPLQIISTYLINQVDQVLLKLLICGVGVYSKKGLSQKYLNIVQKLAIHNNLAYLISDDSFCYGQKFPFSHVILTNRLVDQLNIDKIFLFIGKAAKTDEGWNIRIFIEKHGIHKLLSYIHNIHNTKCKQESYGQIFEKLAQKHLDYTQVK